jgi:hypothetical protein
MQLLLVAPSQCILSGATVINEQYGKTIMTLLKINLTVEDYRSPSAGYHQAHTQNNALKHSLDELFSNWTNLIAASKVTAHVTSLVFWDVMQQIGSSLPMFWEEGTDRLCLNVSNYQSTPCNIPEEQRSHLHCSRSPKFTTAPFLG